MLWASTQILKSFTQQLQESLNLAPGSIIADTPLTDVFEDSLDSIEFVMELQEESGVLISDEAAGAFKTIGDVIRYIEARRRGETPP